MPTANLGDALRLLKLIPTDIEVHRYAKLVDPKNSGTIKFEHFLSVAASLWMNPAQLSGEAWAAFLIFDKCNTGRISTKLFMKILTAYGLEPIPHNEANKIIKKYSSKSTDTIEYGCLIRAWLK
ncbi:unnamed protein product [Calicophoron daubneyi]|uniref:EF-hand domain-containing protein n=1 Tax=Calicophoron daubneyi TaxID=300641 RepID=A0AAV2TPR2_CALDB